MQNIQGVISLGGNPCRNMAVNGHGGKLITGVTEGCYSSQELVLSQSGCKMRHRCDVSDLVNGKRVLLQVSTIETLTTGVKFFMKVCLAQFSFKLKQSLSHLLCQH